MPRYSTYEATDGYGSQFSQFSLQYIQTYSDIMSNTLDEIIQRRITTKFYLGVLDVVK